MRLPEFLVASGDPANNALVEALEPGQHFGGAKFFDRAGHIPNAIMMPSADFYNADKTFKSPEEIRRMLALPRHQARPARSTRIAAAASPPACRSSPRSSCWTTPRSSSTRNPSSSGCATTGALPFWTYDAPNLTRERTWLNGWGNPMMRSFGVAKLSVIDVRPPASFKQAHVPFAINDPGGRVQAACRDAREAGRNLGGGGSRRCLRSGDRFGRGIEPRFGPRLPHAGKAGTEASLGLLGFRGRLGICGLPAEQGKRSADPKKAPRGRVDLLPRRTPSISARASSISDSQRHQGALSEGLHRVRQIASREGARRESHPRALHRPRQRQRNA